ALRGALWLVLPALLGLVLYYMLYPLMQVLTYRGLARNRAAALVMLVFLGAACALIAVVGPHVVSQAADWHTAADRYVQGGIRFLRNILLGLEANFEPFARAHLADTITQRINQSSSLVEQLEPVGIALSTYLPPLMLVPFLAYFFLRDGRRFKNLLSGAVPNAYFEKSLSLLHQVDRIASAYFIGLLKLTLLDTVTLAGGLALLHFPGALTLGLTCAVLAWIPFVGSVCGGLLVVLVAATDFPDAPSMAYSVAGLFVLVRLLDDFVYMPLTVGRELRMHPLLTVVMIFAGGAVAGVAGLMLVLPVLGVVRIIGETIGVVAADQRLMARHRHAQGLRRHAAARDLAFDLNLADGSEEG
ncbi:MAG: AI-2E family transporter, partial [Burkholderiaceae bacterium]|nr:AI-2E family transporter [Burkholderiaceae bacterium]